MRWCTTNRAVRRAVHLLAVAAIATVGVVATTAGAGSAVPPTAGPSVLWGQIKTVGTGIAGDVGAINDLACPADGTCVGVGARADGADWTPTVAASSGGVWGAFQPVDVSGLAQDSPPRAELKRVTCTAVGACTTVGWYRAADTNEKPFVVTQTAGTWGAAVSIDTTAFPHQPVTEARVLGLACSSVGNCTLVGSFRAGQWEAFTATSTAGVWAAARAVTFSGAANATGVASARAVACPADGACTVIGEYATATGTEMFAASSTAGTWSDAERIAMPAGAATDPEVENLYQNTLSCSAPQVCTAIGTYRRADRPLWPHTFAATSSGGAFLPAQAISVDPGLSSNGSLMSALSCPTSGACTMAGFLARAGCVSGSPSCIVTPGVATSTGGVWSDIVEVPVADELRTEPAQLAGAFDVSCPYTTDDCALVGYFRNAAGGWESLAANRLNGAWSLARRVAGPQNPGSPDSDVLLGRVVCSFGTRCTAIGLDGSDSALRPIAVEAWPMPTTPGAIRTTTKSNSRTVVVTWTPPVAPIYRPTPLDPAPGTPDPESYQVRCETGVGEPVFVGAGASPARVTLPAGATARCGVRARYGSAVPENSFVGDWFEGPLGWAAPVTVPSSPPDAPVDVRATTPPLPSGQSTTMSFTLPPNLSGSPVSGVEAQCTSTDGGTSRTVTGTTSPLTLTGLSKGRTYRCAVRAVNGIGRSGWATSAPIVVPAGPPTAVRASTPTARSRSTTVTFTRPDGGPAVSTYRVACVSSDGGQARTLVKAGAPYVVEGLTPGKTYRCTVVGVYSYTPGEVSSPSSPVVVPTR